MSEREFSVAERVWRDAGIEPEPQKINLAPLTERADFRQPYIARHLGAFRRFLRCGLDAGGRLPDEVFLETLLANGRAAALALVDAFLAERGGELVEGVKEEVDAVLVLARLARMARVISWDLDGWRPAPTDPAREKVGIYIDSAVAERARVAAFTSKESISRFFEQAAAERIARLEKSGRKIEPREPRTVSATA